MQDLLQIVFRSCAVYIFMLIALRLAGKKELSQLNTSDIILILLISNAVQNAMVGPDTSLLGGIVAAAVLFLLNGVLKYIMFRQPKFREMMNQHPEILVHNGIMNFHNLSKLSISHDELMEAVREHGIEHLKEVKWAIFETDGNISIISGETHLKHTQYRKRHKRQNVNQTQ